MSPSDTLTRPRLPKVAGNTRRHGADRSRRSVLRTVLIAALVAALASGVGWLVFFSSVLAARNVAVSGVSALHPDDVRAAAQVPLGVPLARQDVDALAQRVATLKPVKSVTVTRGWPNTVKIAVVERTAVLAVRQPEGELLFDAGGFGFGTATSVPKGVLVAEVNPGDVAGLVRAGSVAAALPPSLKARVDAVQASSASGITLKLHGGALVVWGAAEDSELKAKVTTALLQRRARVYDVSAPLSPTIR